MSDYGSPAPVLPKKRRIWRFIAFVAIIGLTLAGFLAYTIYQNLQYGSFEGCAPYPKLSIQGARAQVESSEPTICQTTEFTAVCPIFIVGGTPGT